MKILILKDYRGHFYSSTKTRASSMNIEKIEELFRKLGYLVETKNFVEINFREESYTGVFVLYQSAEDPNLFYKEYIEDILLGLELQGAILIPDFYKFRAHHNKVFMEILRDLSNNKKVSNIRSKSFGTYEDFSKTLKTIELPAVIKPSAGSKSRGVALALNEKALKRIIKKETKSFSFFNLKWKISNFFDRKGYKATSNNRRKIITQNFIKNLQGDFKIVIYGEKYFPLYRKNRPGDFRASGGGLLYFSEHVPHEVLDFAQETFSLFSVPFASFDIGFNNKGLYLLEFQFLSFGQYAVEKSSHFFTFLEKEGRWKICRQQILSEKVLVESVDFYIKNYLTSS